MTQEFSHRAEVITGFQQVGGEAMAQGMVVTHRFGATDGFGSLANGFLLATGVQMMAATSTGSRLSGHAVGREDILPAPRSFGVGVW
nr:hypothetical protein [Chloroflexus sp.]